MEKTKNLKKDNNLIAFKTWIRMQPSMNISAVKAEIIEKCKLKKQENGRCYVLEDWCLGRVKVPALAQSVINEIAGTQLNYEVQNQEVEA
jgi:hypothetical protein